MKGTDAKPRPALGLFEGSVYPTFQCALAAEDLVLLFTDGLYDVEGKEDVLVHGLALFRGAKT